MVLLILYPNKMLTFQQKLIQYQALQAICFCHENNYVHRDIKPDNFLVNWSDGVKLCDFGSSTYYQQDRHAMGEEGRLASF